jgi:YD repeat-containing protein
VLGIYPRANNGLPDSTQALAVVSRQDYDGFGDLANLRYRTGGAVLLQQSVQRDALGRITRLDESAPGGPHAWGYRYDEAGRLYGVTASGDTVARFRYDGNGNRVTFLGATSADTASGTYDAQDRLVRYGAASYAYTANGELASKVAGGATTSYTYDALGNLVSVQLPGGPRIDYLECPLI